MPELPEVEYARRQLETWLLKTKIRSAKAGPGRTFRPADRKAFELNLPGRSLISARRRGKWLLLTFDRDLALLCHLGMTGKWLFRKAGEDAPRHARARIVLARGCVYYNDPRRFGRIEVRQASELSSAPALRSLGPDPLTDGLDPVAIHERLARSARPIKVALLDQSLFAGVGNILATDALFRARLSPLRPCKTLTTKEVRKLVRGVNATIAADLRSTKGEEEIAYVEEGGKNPFLIYDRAGEKCPHCGATILKRVIAGRTTAYCPVDQPDPTATRKRNEPAPRSGKRARSTRKSR